MGVICSYHLVWWVLSQWEIIAAGLMTNNRVDMFPLRVKSRTLRGLDDEEHTGGKKIIVAFKLCMRDKNHILDRPLLKQKKE